MEAIINGNSVKSTEASINMYDLGFNRGHSIFEYFRFKNAKPRFLKAHLDRLMHSVAKANIQFEVSRTELETMIRDLIEKSEYAEGSIRLTVSAGNSSNFSRPETKANYYILTLPFTALEDSIYDTGSKLITMEYQRQFPSIKTTNYFFAQMNRSEMLKAGATDILYFDKYIRETSRANIFLIRDGVIFTPQTKILKGITRMKVLSLFPNIKLQDLPPEFIHDCSEIFITSSSKQVLPIVEIDGSKIGDGTVGPKTKEIMLKFKELVNKQ